MSRAGPPLRRPSTPDSLPILGAAPGRPGLYLAFGHGHFGMTGGPPSGRALARLITGADPGLDLRPYAPTRFGRLGRTESSAAGGREPS